MNANNQIYRMLNSIAKVGSAGNEARKVRGGVGSVADVLSRTFAHKRRHDCSNVATSSKVGRAAGRVVQHRCINWTNSWWKLATSAGISGLLPASSAAHSAA
jgi:hypothetical protein